MAIVINTDVTTPQGFVVSGTAYTNIQLISIEKSSGVVQVFFSTYVNQAARHNEAQPIAIVGLTPNVWMPVTKEELEESNIYPLMYTKLKAHIGEIFGTENLVDA